MIRFLVENDFEKLLGETVGQWPLDATLKVLNIACEFQRVPPWLPMTVASANVFGLEINREIVAKDPNVKYCDVDRDRFPFEDGMFDLAVSVFGVEHFKTGNVFHEAQRALKPGGRFVFLVPNLLYPAFFLNRLLGQRFAAFFYRTVMRSHYRPHAAFYRFNTLRAIRRAARDSGFGDASLTFFGPANILWYVRRSAFAQKLVTAFERLLTNRLLFHFKPYILVVLKK